MYYRAVQVKGRAYANLIMHLVRHCDVVTFNVPYFHWKVGTTKPTVISDREMVSYLEEIENFLEWLRPYIIDDYFDNKYVGQTCGHMMRILTVRLSADIFDCFIAQDSIFDWDFPTDVQDLCFFQKASALFALFLMRKYLKCMKTMNQK